MSSAGRQSVIAQAAAGRHRSRLVRPQRRACVPDRSCNLPATSCRHVVVLLCFSRLFPFAFSLPVCRRHDTGARRASPALQGDRIRCEGCAKTTAPPLGIVQAARRDASSGCGGRIFPRASRATCIRARRERASSRGAPSRGWSRYSRRSRTAKPRRSRWRAANRDTGTTRRIRR